MPRLAEAAIDDLNVALGIRGSTIKIARLSDAPEGAQSAFYCERVPAMVVLAQPQETLGIGAGGTIQDTTIIISPTWRHVANGRSRRAKTIAFGFRCPMAKSWFQMSSRC